MAGQIYEPNLPDRSQMRDGIIRCGCHLNRKGMNMFLKLSKSPNRRKSTLAAGSALLLLLSLPMAGAQSGELRARGSASPHGLKADGGGTLPDFHCGPGQADVCDAAFTAKCKDKGGTLSGEQGWGGKTCWTPGGW
jgi:hypothetical protein